MGKKRKNDTKLTESITRSSVNTKLVVGKKPQTQLTWCNSHFWWAIGAEGLTGSRSLRQCLSPCWTGDGTPHSYQCKSTVKEKQRYCSDMFYFLQLWLTSLETWTPYYSGSFNCNKHLDFHYFLLLFISYLSLPAFLTRTLCTEANRDAIPLIRPLSRELKQCKQLTCGKGSGVKNAPLWYPFYSRLFKRWKINKRKTGFKDDEHQIIRRAKVQLSLKTEIETDFI